MTKLGNATSIGQCCGRDWGVQVQQRSGEHHQPGGEGAHQAGDLTRRSDRIRGTYHVI
jgi:hypothetical protein